tara:strand:+ start:921 stop:2516 length:1596 start_codon:yes stop_codon:yes gene_type:complete
LAKKKNGKVKEDKSFEEKLWDSAEKLRGPLESAQYKYVVLGLLFLKFASDIYQDRRSYLEKETQNPKNKEYYQKTTESRDYVINDSDEYHKESVLFIRKGNTWNELMKSASQENLGIKIDNMLNEIETDNPVLQGVMPKIYSQVKLPNENVLELINLFSTIHHGKTRGIDFDFLGRTYEFFLGKFSSREDVRAGEFYTPHSIVQLITEFLEPNKGRIYDPTCGSGGMFVQSMEFNKAHVKNSKNNLSFYAQEFKEGIWQLCKMNLILRGIDTSNVKPGDSLRNDQHVDLKSDYIMANPPFNMKEWGYEQLKNDKRWVYGIPSDSKPGGNFAFMQHMLYHLDKNGKMGLVLSNGSLSSPGNEAEIRKNVVEDDLVDCIVSLPPKLFYTRPLPVCIWFFTKNKNDGINRKRNGEILFINARDIFTPVDRTHRKLSAEQISEISSTYRSYLGKDDYPEFEEKSGYCKIVSMEEIRTNKYILSPGRYVGAKDIDNDEETFTTKMTRFMKEYTDLSEEYKQHDKQLQKFLNKLDLK